MDNIIRMLPESMQRFSTYIDFIGQRKAERIFQVIILATAVIGFFIGHQTQQFSHAVYLLGIGFFISCLLVVPPWPYLRRNPIQWQPVQSVKTTPVKEKKKTK